MWAESVLLGFKLLFGSTQRPHFFLTLDGEETAKSQVVGYYEHAIDILQTAGAAKRDFL